MFSHAVTWADAHLATDLINQEVLHTGNGDDRRLSETVGHETSLGHRGSPRLVTLHPNKDLSAPSCSNETASKLHSRQR